MTPADHDPIARLLEVSGSRPAPAPDRMLRAKAAVRDAWQRECRWRAWRKRGLQTVIALTSAATVAVSIDLWWKPSQRLPSPLERRVGQVEIIRGRLDLIKPGSATGTLAVGAVLTSGAIVEAGDESRAAVRLASGVSVRMDRRTRLRLSSERVIDLERGAVYVESDSQKGASVEIRTPLGVVTDIGTRFESRLENGVLRVRVRDGRAAIRTGRGMRECAAAAEVAVNRDGHLSERPFAPSDAAWEWTHELAPLFVLEGSGLRAFLDWTARENGWSWRFVDDETARRASSVTLHGSLDGVLPSQALAVVLPAANLRYHVRGGHLTVGLASWPQEMKEGSNR